MTLTVAVVHSSFIALGSDGRSWDTDSDPPVAAEQTAIKAFAVGNYVVASAGQGVLFDPERYSATVHHGLAWLSGDGLQQPLTRSEAALQSPWPYLLRPLRQAEAATIDEFEVLLKRRG